MTRQELFCHGDGCHRYVQFDIDLSLNGNHVLNCPNCGHEHCRVVKDGIITDDRWDVRGGATIHISNTYMTTSATSTWDTYSMTDTTTSATSVTLGNVFTYGAWMNTTGGT